MSCNCNNTTNGCGDTTIPPVSAGKKISELNSLYQVSANDLFVVVDVTANETKNVTYEQIITFDNSGTNLSANTFPDAIIELDEELSVHIQDYSIHYPMSAIDGLVLSGGNTGQVLVKNSTSDFDYSWQYVSGSGGSSGIPDAPNTGNTYLREFGNWVLFDPDEKADVSAVNEQLNNYTTTADFDNHVNDPDIHYEMSAIDHLVIQNVGNYVHTQIDSHIDDGSIHYPMSAIDAYTKSETDLLLGQKADTSALGDYYTKSEVDTALDGKEDYLGTQLSDGQILASSGADVRYWIDAPTGGGIDDVLDNETYLRTSGAWIQSDQFTSANYYNVSEVNILLNDKADLTDLDNYTPVSAFDNHVNDTDIHFEMSAIDHELIQNIGIYTHPEIDSHIDDGSIHFPTSAVPTIGTVSFVYAGGVNNSVILEKFSAFSGNSGFKIPSNKYITKITGYNIYATSSYHDGLNTHNASIRLAEYDGNNPTVYNFGLGDEVYSKTDLFAGSIQSGTTYSFIQSIDLQTPIELNEDRILYCEFHPNFWIFSDFEISLIYSIERV